MTLESFTKKLIEYIDECMVKTKRKSLQQIFHEQFTDFNQLVALLIDFSNDLYPETVRKVTEYFNYNKPDCKMFSNIDTLFASIFSTMVLPPLPDNLIDAYSKNLEIYKPDNVIKSFGVFLATIGAINVDDIGRISTIDDVVKTIDSITESKDKMEKIKYNIESARYAAITLTPISPKGRSSREEMFNERFIKNLLNHCKNTLKDQYRELRDHINDIKVKYVPEDEDRALSFISSIDCQVAFDDYLKDMHGASLYNKFSNIVTSILTCIDYSKGDNDKFEQCLSKGTGELTSAEIELVAGVTEKKQEEERKRTVADTLYTYVLSQLGLEGLPESEVYDLVETVFKNYKQVKDKMSFKDYIKLISGLSTPQTTPKEYEKLINSVTTLAKTLPKDALDSLQDLIDYINDHKDKASYYVNFLSMLAQSIRSHHIDELYGDIEKYRNTLLSGGFDKARDYLDKFLSDLLKALAPPAPPIKPIVEEVPEEKPSGGLPEITLISLNNKILEISQDYFKGEVEQHAIFFPIINKNNKYYTFIAVRSKKNPFINPDGTVQVIRLNILPNTRKDVMQMIQKGIDEAKKLNALSTWYSIKFDMKTNEGKLLFGSWTMKWTHVPELFLYLRPLQSGEMFITVAVIRGTEELVGSDKAILLAEKGMKYTVLARPNDIEGITVDKIIKELNEGKFPIFIADEKKSLVYGGTSKI